MTPDDLRKASAEVELNFSHQLASVIFHCAHLWDLDRERGCVDIDATIAERDEARNACAAAVTAERLMRKQLARVEQLSGHQYGNPQRFTLPDSAQLMLRVCWWGGAGTSAQEAIVGSPTAAHSLWQALVGAGLMCAVTDLNGLVLWDEADEDPETD